MQSKQTFVISTKKEQCKMSNPLRRLFTTSTLLTARCKEQPIRVNTSERIDVIHYVAKQRITRHNQRNSTIMSLAVHFQHVFFFFYFSMYSELVNRNPSSTLLSVSIVVVLLRLDTINWMSKWHDQFTSVKKTPNPIHTNALSVRQTILFQAKSKSTRFTSRLLNSPVGF